MFWQFVFYLKDKIHVACYSRTLDSILQIPLFTIIYTPWGLPEFIWSMFYKSYQYATNPGYTFVYKS